MVRANRVRKAGTTTMGQTSSQPGGATQLDGAISPAEEDVLVVDEAVEQDENDNTFDTPEQETLKELTPHQNGKRSSKKKRVRERESSEAAQETQAAPKQLVAEPNGHKKSKKKRRKAAEQEEPQNEEEIPNNEEIPNDKEAESALALLQLRKEVQFDNPAHTLSEEIASHAQLDKEYSSKSKSKKRKRRQLQDVTFDEPQEDHEQAQNRHNTNEFIEYGLPTPFPTGASALPPSDDLNASTEYANEFSCASKPNGTATYVHNQSPGEQSLLPTVNRLDDIDSNDEGLAPLLQEYEGELDLLQVFGDADDDPSYRQLDSMALEQAAAAALHHNSDLPYLSMVTAPKEKKHKKRKKRVPEFSAVNADKDVIVALENMRQRKPGFAIKDDHTPIDPKLTSNGFSVMQLPNYSHPDTEVSEASAATKPSKLKRISARMRNRDGETPSATLDGYVYQIPAGKGSRKNDSSRIETSTNRDQTQRKGSNDSPQGTRSTPASGHKKRRMPALNARYPNGDLLPPSSGVSQTFQRPKNYNPTAEDLARHGGPFTAEESALIYRFRDDYCEYHDMPHEQFADRVQANARNVPSLNTFWTEVCSLIPYRGRQPIQKFCRRQFHNFEKRGAWTKEDDEELKLAVIQHGKSWKRIGELCGRMAEDVRDRYRNYIYNSEHRNSEGWTTDEVQALCLAVGECIWSIKKERWIARQEDLQRMGFTIEPDDELEEAEAEKLIVWQVVSDGMGGSRGRLQCSYKWKQLKLSGRTSLMKEYRKRQRAHARLQKGKDPDEPYPSQGWREVKARKKVTAKMLPGDQFDVLDALAHCDASEERAISWQRLGQGEKWRERWNAIDLRVAWSMMKEELDQADDLGTQYKDFGAQVMQRLTDSQPERLEERWDPLFDETTSDDANNSSSDEQVETRKPRGKGKAKAKRRATPNTGKEGALVGKKPTKGKGKAKKAPISGELVRASDDERAGLDAVLDDLDEILGMGDVEMATDDAASIVSAGGAWAEGGSGVLQDGGDGQESRDGLERYETGAGQGVEEDDDSRLVRQLQLLKEV